MNSKRKVKQENSLDDILKYHLMNSKTLDHRNQEHLGSLKELKGDSLNPR